MVEVIPTTVWQRLGRHYWLLGIVLLEIGLRLFLNRWDFYIDDPIITFRYTQNLLAGRGFTFNPGEQVLGTTTPLYALVLTVPTALGLPVWLSSRLVDLLADIANIALIYAILHRISKQPFIPIFGALIFAFSPFLNLYAMNGMETPLVIALMLGALYAAMSKRRVLTGVLAGLALFARIDTALFALLLCLALWWENKRLPVKETLWAAITVAPWVVFATLYFGSPIPVTLQVKLVYYAHLINPVYAWGTVLYVLDNSLPPLLLYAALTGLGLLTNIKQKYVLMIFVWIVLYIAINMITSPNSHHWYYTPPVPFIIILAALGWGFLLGRLFTVLKHKIVQIAAMLVIALGSTGLTIPVWSGEIAGYIQRLIVVTAHGRQISLWMNRNLPPDAVFCTTNPGYPGMYTKFRILDTGCLVSPQLLPLYKDRSWDEGDRLALERYQPDFWLTVMRPGGELPPNYVALKEFIPTQKSRTKDRPGIATICVNRNSPYAAEVLARKTDGDPQFQPEPLLIKP
jgi:hypothetical protein